MPATSPVYHVLLLVEPALMASNMLAARWIEGSIPPVALAFWRWVATFAVLLPMVLPRLAAHRAALAREWKGLAVLGGLAMGLCGAPVYLGGQTTTATNIGMIYAASPVLIVLMAWAFWGEAVSRRQVAGIALSLAGVLAIVAKGDPATLLSLSFVRGDLWILLAMASWSLYSLLVRYSRTELPLMVRLQGIVVAGILWNVPLYGLELALGVHAVFDARTLLIILFLALVPGLISFLVYNRLIAVLGPARTGLTMYLTPVYNAAMAWALLGEEPRFYHLLGAALVLPGIYLATVKGAKAAETAPSRA